MHDLRTIHIVNYRGDSCDGSSILFINIMDPAFVKIEFGSNWLNLIWNLVSVGENKQGCSIQGPLRHWL